MDTFRNNTCKAVACTCNSIYVRVMPRKGTVNPEIFHSDFPSTWRPLYEDTMEGATPPPQDTMEKPDDVEIYEAMKPMIYIMKFFGLFPFNIYKSDKGTEFRRCYVSMVYSFVLYVVMNVYAYHVGTRRIQFIRSSAAKFDDLMFSLVLFIYLVPHIYLIPTHWKEAGKVASYFNLWNEYQAVHRNVTGRSLVLTSVGKCRLRNMSFLFAVIVPLFALGFSVAEHLMILGNPNLELPFYWYILTIIMLHAAWWWLTCAAQRSAFRALSTAFFTEPVGHVEEYRQLWLRLSHICRQSGDFMFDTYGHLTVLCFTAVTMTLYGALSDSGQYTRHLGLTICVLTLMLTVFLVADSAHRTWTEAGPDFLHKLSLLYPVDKKARKELKLFILVVSMNPPKINLGGYIDIDRSFMLKFFSTMVTYLLVLLQFRLGVLSLGGTAASTGAPSFVTGSTVE